MDLTLLTLNTGLLRLGRLPFLRIEPAPFVPQRFEQLGACLVEAGADLVALQEIYDLDFKRRLRSQLASEYPHAWFREVSPWLGLPNGLMLLSRLPMREVRFHRFASSGLDERFSIRPGFVVATVVVGCIGEFTLANLHTTAGGILRHPEAPKTDAIRARQIRQVLHVIEEPRRPSMVVGDLNAGPGVSEANYRLLLDLGFVDAHVDARRTGAGDPGVTWDPKNPLNNRGPHQTSPPQRIDHVLVSPMLRRRVGAIEARIVFDQPVVDVGDGQRVTLSDHYGLWTKFEVLPQTVDA